MYEKNGEKYFIVDRDMHFWDASPASWVSGHENYAKGWIECFHAYQGSARFRRTGRSSISRSTPSRI